MAGPAQIDFLRTNSFLDKFTETELVELLPELIPEDYPEKSLILKAGEGLDRIILVMKGSIRLEKEIILDFAGNNIRRNNEVLEVIAQGNHLGAAALLENVALSADLLADSDCSLLSLTKGTFRQILASSNNLGRKLLLTVAEALAADGGEHVRRLEVESRNHLLMEQMRTERKKIRAIHRIAKSTVHSSVNQTLDTILEACMECLAVEKGSVMIFQQGGLRVEAAFGADKNEIIGEIGEISENSISGRCFMTGKPILIEDITREKNIKRAGSGRKYFNNSLLSMPLLSISGEAIGVLNVSKTSTEIFSREDLAILEDLAQEAGAALAHEISLARLFHGFQRAFVGIKQAGGQLREVSDDISRVLAASWPQNEDPTRD